MERRRVIKLSFVVSTFNRPGMLPIVLHALAVQTCADFEVIVTNNGPFQHECREVVDAMDSRFSHVDTSLTQSCYESAELAVANWATGDFICFPSDDSYYVPCFAEVMLKAAEENRWDLVYCNMVYDARFNGQCYGLVNVQPMENSIDKTGFILRRSRFVDFPGKTAGGPCNSDGLLIEALLRSGISHGKVPDVLMVHN